jgi:flavin-dependent dehydrogenase
MRRTYDVIIVGARVAGAATAWVLARAGLRVLAIDRQPHGTDTISTHAMMRGGVLQLSRWGILTPLLNVGTPLVTITTFHYGDEELAVAFRADADVSGLVAPRRTRLDPMLVAAARAAGADIRHLVVLRSLVRDDKERVRGIVCEDGSGAIHTLQAPLVIGADGIGSAVAGLAGARILERGRHSASTIYGYAKGLPNTGFHWFYREGIAAGIIPTNDNETCVFTAVPTAAFDARFRHDVAGTFEDVLAAIDPQRERQIQQSRTGSLSVFRGRPGFLRQAHGPGWALVGDAGFFRDPLTAHGITDALRDAEGLAEAVLRGDGQTGRYQAERDEIARPLLETTDRIVSFGWDLPTLQELHRDLNKAMKAELVVIASRIREPVPERSML